MTPDELIARLKAIKSGTEYDTETGHMEADRLLLVYINDQRVTDAFEDLHRWYA